MKRSKFQRILSLVLAFAFLVGGGTAATVSVSASESESESEISEIKEIMNSDTYNEYVQKHSNTFVRRDENGNVVYDLNGNPVVDTEWKVPNATETIVIDAVNDVDEAKTNADIRTEVYDGVEALYTPGEGTVAWTFQIEKTARYSIVLEYYPIEGKTASIERIFRINGEVPFKEARYITISKNYTNDYTNGRYYLGKGENADEYLAKATELGLKAEKREEDGTLFIEYEMPEFFTSEITDYLEGLGIRFFTTDIDDNEIRSAMIQSPEWKTFELRDMDGFYVDSFEFILSADSSLDKTDVTISLTGVNEPMALKRILLIPHEDLISYEDYSAKFANAPKGSDIVKIEAEYPSAISSKTIYATEDRTSAVNSPSSTKHTYLNTIGGEKWQTSGQWVSYNFKVNSSGMYNIVSRFKQNILDGMYTSRSLRIYTDYDYDEYVAEFGNDLGYYDGLPFKEAGNIRYEYSSNWQANAFNDGDTTFDFYFEKDVVYTIVIEATLGSMADIIRTIDTALADINSDYLEILKLTGSNPDEYNDYGFKRIMPQVLEDMVDQSELLYQVAEDITDIAGEKSSMVATLNRVAWLLDIMGKDEEKIATYLQQLKSYIGTLGTWLSDSKTQPLQIDYILIQSSEEPLPKAKAGFFQSIWHEIMSFIMSFFRNYDRMGASSDESANKEAVEAWLATGRDQAQVVRNLINNDFSANSDITVDLKLVAGGTLLPSILAGMGPDVYIGLGQGDVINYAIRGALEAIEDLDGFYDFAIPYLVDENGEYISDPEGNRIVNENANFNEAAMLPLGIEDAYGEFHYYGIPETQNFSMMFVRKDILAEMGIEIPKTWDDILAAVKILGANNMEIGLAADYNMFLYQMGGELFADGGMRINFESNVALRAFEYMCNMFTQYSFPYTYDFANRFRTGEMPIGIANYTGAYNQLKVFATELEGLWGIYPLPGWDFGDGVTPVNNVAVSSVTAIVMISGCDDEDRAWEFMKWHAGEKCQAEYANEMVAIIGESAKHPTANLKALASLPWNSEEYKQISLQIGNLASIPNYPGTYIIDRHVNFAFLAAYNDKANPVDELRSYVTTINKEITRKRQEFDLETTDYVGQTLAQKRMKQVSTLLSGETVEHLSYSYSLSSQTLKDHSELKSLIENAIYKEEIDLLFDAEAAVSELVYGGSLSSEDKTGWTIVMSFLNDAASALTTYKRFE